MKRDLKNISRDLENTRNNDIIRKKRLLEEMFYEDPDLVEILGAKEKMPLNKYSDPSNPTKEELEERRRINDYNERITHKQILPYLKLNGIQKEVLNFVLFDISDREVNYYNNVIKTQQIIVVCLVHEDDMETQYNIIRTDLLSYIVKDLICWTNALGMQFKCVNDFPDITDGKYYSRTLKFEADVPNVNHGHMGMHNKYDRPIKA